MADPLEYLVQNEPSFRRARLPALYSDFRSQQALNPDSYQANISAWRKGLTTLTYAGLASDGASAPSRLVLKADESLLRALESKQYGRPLALGAVVREAALTKDLIPTHQFLDAKESIYHKSWGQLPWNVASWVFRQLGIGAGDKLPNADFVVVANVEAVSRQVLKDTLQLTTRFERTISTSQFKQKLADVQQGQGELALSQKDVDILLKFMSRDKQLLLCDGKTVKLNPIKGQETAITQEDETIASLNDLTEHLNHQIDILTKKLEETTMASKEAVLKKNRVGALAALKSKKLAELSLEKRYGTLNQITEVSNKIEQAADNVQIVNVMSASANVLKGLNDKVGGAERVDEVVDRMREQMGQADEINNILAEGDATVDEAEIDDELEAMEAEQKEKDAAVERARMEKARAEEQTRQEVEAEKTAKRLAELETVPVDEAASKQTPTEELGRLSLDENRQAQHAT